MGQESDLDWLTEPTSPVTQKPPEEKVSSVFKISDEALLKNLLEYDKWFLEDRLKADRAAVKELQEQGKLNSSAERRRNWIFGYKHPYLPERKQE